MKNEKKLFFSSFFARDETFQKLVSLVEMNRGGKEEKKSMGGYEGIELIKNVRESGIVESNVSEGNQKIVGFVRQSVANTNLYLKELKFEPPLPYFVPSVEVCKSDYCQLNEIELDGVTPCVYAILFNSK